MTPNQTRCHWLILLPHQCHQTREWSRKGQKFPLEEIFGPFATILEFDGIDEAIELANDSEFGLVSYIWSTDIRKIMRAQAEIRAGVVWVNTPLMRELRAPFGGYKNSGIGRDGGEWSRNLFTEEKTVSIPLKDFPITKLGEED